MNSKVGKVSWGSPELKPSSTEEAKKIPFTNMSGYGVSFKGRVVSEDPIRYNCHFTTNKNGKIVKVNCTGGADCPVMIEKTKTPCGGYQADSRFYLKWLNRETKIIEVLDVGKQIINAIGELMDNEDWGHCKNYDITINKGEKGAMPLYTVTPSPRKELTSEELQLAANSEDPNHEDFLDLESRIQPLTAEKVNTILGFASAPKPAAVAKPTPVSNSSKDEEFEDIDWGDE